ncbi:cystatin-B-like protein [Labeo rohita]|uniref:Cystatin-B-like protein n=1 Tax=Labeo rohita TaxID=84645 RepID=A0A498LQE9_LABRO|nr:cystatin-B-like protein [Labeo rohita]
MSRIVGGPSEEQPATPEVQKICNEMKHEAEKKAGKKFDVFVAKSFTTQALALEPTLVASSIRSLQKPEAFKTYMRSDRFHIKEAHRILISRPL